MRSSAFSCYQLGNKIILNFVKDAQTTCKLPGKRSWRAKESRLSIFYHFDSVHNQLKLDTTKHMSICYTYYTVLYIETHTHAHTASFLPPTFGDLPNVPIDEGNQVSVGGRPMGYSQCLASIVATTQHEMGPHQECRQPQHGRPPRCVRVGGGKPQWCEKRFQTRPSLGRRQGRLSSFLDQRKIWVGEALKVSNEFLCLSK